MSYKVPFIDYPAHYRSMQAEITSAISDVLFRRADLILRDDVKEFESRMASFLGTEYAVGVNSCTDALHLSLYASGVVCGDEVITVAHTFLATLEAIIWCGATPVLVDIGEDFNMSVDLVEDAITAKTKAILPVHLNGRVCNMEKLLQVTRKHNLIMIEDAAQALGATFDGKKAGSFGLAGCFSFYPAKLLGAAGDAGLVVTNSRELADKIRLLRDHGRKSKQEHAFYGFNSRLDNLQAAILNVKLQYLARWIQHRREIAGMYREGLQDISSLRLPHFNESRHFDVYQNYVIRAQDRNALVEHLNKMGVEVLVSWRTPLHKQTGLGLDHLRLPLTEQISNEVVSLPMNTELTEDHIKYVIECVRKFYL